ncbi:MULTISPECIES: hypothetical protein [Streptomyces]|uniref:Uncharacterized protein n=1 Tax=Streptomyces pratisoli TaxID=3139917 RepID=A0ACC6QKU2_9ACTN|nr:MULTISPECIES: hypothetical protein [unclassified Streptomyces]MCX4512377.1 hypothetical protein [Streptomyces sp. NBC_01619]
MSDEAGVAPIVVHGVIPGDPPFRMVDINGETVGTAHDMLDVIRLAHAAGLDHLDLDDPAFVRWVGGGKYKWVP